MEDINWKMFVAPIVILFVFIGGIIGIVNWQKSKQEEAPVVEEFTVNLPEGEIQSEQKEIIVSGNANEADQVFINGSEVKIDSDGVYTKAVVLNEGKNTITIQSKKDGEETAFVERTVTYTLATPASETTSVPVEGQPVPSVPAPVSPTSSSLAASGPEEVIIPIIGFGGVIATVAYYTKSKKQLALNLRK